MRTLAAGLLLLTATGCSSIDTSQPVSEPPAPEQQKIAGNMDTWLSAYDVPAAAIAYIENGKVAWTAVYGEQSPGIPATPETLFNIASMTKPISAEALLRMVSDGELALGETMSAHWIDPDIMDDPRHNQLTPEIALRHKAGFPNWRDAESGGLAFQSNPGEQTSYSGEGYNYVARFAEEKMGRAFTELTKTYVFDAIGMGNTTYVEQDWFAGRIAHPQGPDGEIGPPDIRTEWNAADDVYTTIIDYAAFMVSVMKDEGIAPELAAMRFSDVENVFAQGCPWGPETCPISGGFGMGWAVFEYEDETVIVQGGGDWGERTIGFFIPQRDVGIIVFTNGANGSKIISEAAAILYPDSAFLSFLAFQAQQQ